MAWLVDPVSQIDDLARNISIQNISKPGYQNTFGRVGRH